MVGLCDVDVYGTLLDDICKIQHWYKSLFFLSTVEICKELQRTYKAYIAKPNRDPFLKLH